MLRTFVIFLVIMALSNLRVTYAQSLTPTDSSSIWPKRLFIPLFNPSTSTHQVQVAAHSGKDIISLEIFNCLFPVNKYDSHLPLETSKYLEQGDTLLVSMTVLSNSKGDINWEPINPDTISARHLRPLSGQFLEATRRLITYRQAGNPQSHLLATRINIFPIVYRQGHYLTPSSPVLTQYFLIRTRKTNLLDNVDYMTINISGPCLDFDAPWRTIHAMFSHKINYPWSKVLPLGIVKRTIQQGIYEFWSRITFTIADPTVRHYGASLFLYKPSIGLLFGNYVTYFPFIKEYQSLTLDSLVIDGKRQ